LSPSALVAAGRRLTPLFLLAVCWAAPLEAQCPDGTPPPCARPVRAAAPAPSRLSVAVLVFDNLSRDTADAFLAQGLTDAITSSLNGIERLDVRSASAARYYQDRYGRDLKGLARALGVRYLVEGMLVTAPDRISVTVGLVEAATVARRGSWRVVRPRSDLVNLLDAVADSVATEIAGRLDPTERAALGARRTTSAQAMEHLMRGDALKSLFNPGLWERMLDEYETAVRLDPGWARAHARLGSGFARCVEFTAACRGLGRDSLQAIAGREAAVALRLDSSSSEAWLARANYVEGQPYPFDAAALRHAYERAVALDPRDGDAVRQYGDFLRNWPREDSAAVVAFRRALAINPTDATAYAQLARTARYQGRLTDAVALGDSALAITPSNVPALQELTSSLAELGARSRLEQTLRSAPSGSLAGVWTTAVRALAEAASGDSAAAGRRLDSLAARPDLILPPAIDALCRLHRTDEAVRMLVALSPGTGWLSNSGPAAYRGAWLLDRWILCTEIKSDPRYRAWVERDRRAWTP
jgi:TolB-like protein/Tfp pilus assembly protein PilF